MAKLVLGLVGGIGSGKSFVSQLLQERGGYVINADHLGHEALKQPDVKAKLSARWGADVVDAGGEVNRKRIAGIVFANAGERQALESMVFPYIGRRIREEIDKANADPRVQFVVLDAAILLETGWGRSCDKIVFVAAPREVRMARLARRGWTEKEVEARERAQFSLEEKQARAQAVIDNGGEEAATRRQVAELVDRWLPEPLTTQGTRRHGGDGEK